MGSAVSLGPWQSDATAADVPRDMRAKMTQKAVDYARLNLFTESPMTVVPAGVNGSLLFKVDEAR